MIDLVALICAIGSVESGLRPEAYNEKEGARGFLQMREQAWQDAVEFSPVISEMSPYGLMIPEVAIYAFIAYMERYATPQVLIEQLKDGYPPSITMIQIWTRGPTAAKFAPRPNDAELRMVALYEHQCNLHRLNLSSTTIKHIISEEYKFSTKGKNETSKNVNHKTK